MDTPCIMFVGSYTNFDILPHSPDNDKLGKGVYCFYFDEGVIKPIVIIPSENPAVLDFHPNNENILYALNEGIVKNGVIHKIDISLNKIGEKCDVELKVLKENKYQTQGRSLCYFKIHPLNRQYGIAINYWEGSIDVFSMDEKTGECKKIIQHLEHINIALHEKKTRRFVIDREDHWNNRQVGPHAHSIHFYKEWIFIPDLGENSVFQYRFETKNEENILQYECQIYLEEGAGPRHMVFHPRLPIAYVSNELNSTITVLSIDDKIEKENNDENTKQDSKRVRQRMKIIQNVLTTNGDLINNKNYVAEIGISPDGHYIYVTNRGHDLIGIFKIDENNGTLSNIDYVSVQGKCPRHFTITPNGKYLLVCNQDSNSITIFQRSISDGLLKYHSTFTHETFGAPNYITFYPLPTLKSLIKQQKQQLSQSQPQPRQPQQFLSDKNDHNIFSIRSQEYVWGFVLLCFAFLGIIIKLSNDI